MMQIVATANKAQQYTFYFGVIVILGIILTATTILNSKVISQLNEPITSMKLILPQNNVPTLGEVVSFRLIGCQNKSDSFNNYLISGTFARQNKSIVYKESSEIISAILPCCRSMCFTELTAYCGKLYTIDKLSGIVFELNGVYTIPRFIISGGGPENNGFHPLSAEWSTVKDGTFFIGSDSEALKSPLSYVWTAEIDPSGKVKYSDWNKNFVKMQEWSKLDVATRYSHSTALWSTKLQNWIFLPKIVDFNQDQWLARRRLEASTNLRIMLAAMKYPKQQPFHIVLADEGFKILDYKPLEKIDFPEECDIRKYTIMSAKFIPGSEEEEIICVLSASLSQSLPPTCAMSYLFTINILGEVILPPSPAIPSNLKYSGIEFL